MNAALRHDAAEARACAIRRVPQPPPIERLLSGHSGARVLLRSTGKDTFVRKTAANASASPRLQAQADKQHALWMRGLPFPKVRSQFVDPLGVASFDMNYIPGRTIADAVVNGAGIEVEQVAKAVARLAWVFRSGGGGLLSQQLFIAKIHAVVRASALAVNDAAHLQAIQDCGRRLALCDWSAIPETPSHGDLTLENILLTTGKSIAFIDCDETFASSYWLDFGKLFQDIDGHWCIRGLYDKDRSSTALLNARQKLDQLGVRLRLLAAEFDPALPGRLPQLAALGLFRAIPYARTEGATSFLCNRIHRMLEG